MGVRDMYAMCLRVAKTPNGAEVFDQFMDDGLRNARRGLTLADARDLLERSRGPEFKDNLDRFRELFQALRNYEVSDDELYGMFCNDSEEGSVPADGDSLAAPIASAEVLNADAPTESVDKEAAKAPSTPSTTLSSHEEALDTSLDEDPTDKDASLVSHSGRARGRALRDTSSKDASTVRRREADGKRIADFQRSREGDVQMEGDDRVSLEPVLV